MFPHLLSPPPSSPAPGQAWWNHSGVGNALAIARKPIVGESIQLAFSGSPRPPSSVFPPPTSAPRPFSFPRPLSSFSFLRHLRFAPSLSFVAQVLTHVAAPETEAWYAGADPDIYEFSQDFAIHGQTEHSLWNKSLM